MSLEACWMQRSLRFLLHSWVQLMSRLSALTAAVTTAYCYASSYSRIFHQIFSLHSDIHAGRCAKSLIGSYLPLSSGKSLIFLVSVLSRCPACLCTALIWKTKKCWADQTFLLIQVSACTLEWSIYLTGRKSNLFLSQTSPVCQGGYLFYQWSCWLLFPRLLLSCWRESPDAESKIWEGSVKRTLQHRKASSKKAEYVHPSVGDEQVQAWGYSRNVITCQAHHSVMLFTTKVDHEGGFRSVEFGDIQYQVSILGSLLYQNFPDHEKITGVCLFWPSWGSEWLYRPSIGIWLLVKRCDSSAQSFASVKHFSLICACVLWYLTTRVIPFKI